MWCSILPSLTIALCLLLHWTSPSAAENDGLTAKGCEDSREIGDVSRLHAAVEKRLAQEQVVGVRKMSDDQGEKFLLDYWFFDDGSGKSDLWYGMDLERGPNGTDKCNSSRSRDWLNSLSTPRFRPSFPLHANKNLQLLRFSRRQLGFLRNIFSSPVKRDFKCPDGTSSCSSINRPSSCCGNSDTCILISNTGLGDVGCCPQGQTCAGETSSCEPGYTACSTSLGGGCCIPGYECVPGGCAFVSTYTVTAQLTTFVISSTMAASSQTSTASSATTESTSIVSQTTYTPAPPVRPTTDFTTQTTVVTTATLGASACPTGFYACSAIYQGGCCRIGRDCDSTSCPATSSTTVVDSNGVTIAAPTGDTVTTTTAACASGWFSCANTVGGGCCPTGFACGSGCTATTSGATATNVAKTQPQSAAATHRGLSKWVARTSYLACIYFLVL